MSSLDKTLEARLSELAAWSAAASKKLLEGEAHDTAFEDQLADAPAIRQAFSREDAETRFSEIVEAQEPTAGGMSEITLRQREIGTLAAMQKAVLFRRRSYIQALADNAARLEFIGSERGGISYAMKQKLTRLLVAANRTTA